MLDNGRSNKRTVAKKKVLKLCFKLIVLLQLEHHNNHNIDLTLINYSFANDNVSK